MLRFKSQLYTYLCHELGKDAHHNNSHGSKKRPRDKDSRPGM
jgi:hypothetical protein